MLMMFTGSCTSHQHLTPSHPVLLRKGSYVGAGGHSTEGQLQCFHWTPQQGTHRQLLFNPLRRTRHNHQVTALLEIDKNDQFLVGSNKASDRSQQAVRWKERPRCISHEHVLARLLILEKREYAVFSKKM